MGVHESELQMIAAFSALKRDGLSMFRPNPPRFSTQEECIRSRCRTKLLRGGNRSGKTTVAAAMFASFARDVPLELEDGTKVHVRQPHQRGRPMVMWVVGYDWDHIGKTIHRLLFQKNEALRVIKDEETGELRAFEPWNPSDVARQERAELEGRSETEASPPLIPEHEIEDDGWVWKIAGANIFAQVTLKNGTIIFGHSSKEAKAGDAVDMIWVDEKVEVEDNVGEWIMRLADRRGIFQWSCWPASTNTAFRRLSNQALTEKTAKGKVTVREWIWSFEDNPHIPEESKEQIRVQIQAMGPGAVKARIYGLWADDGVKTYPMFNAAVHCAIVDGEREDEISKILRSRNFEPPKEWARFMILDPGSAHPFILFVAKPPPALGDYLIPYAELPIAGADADTLMEAAVPYFASGYHFQSFIIDSHAGKQTAMGFGKTVMANYSRAMNKHGIVSAKTGTGFLYGVDNFQVRKGILEAMMHVNPAGFPKLRIVIEKCPTLVFQIQDAKMHVVQDLVDEKKKGKGATDGLDCLEYAAAAELRWEPPVTVARKLVNNPADEMKRLLREHLYKGDGPRKSQRSVIGACGDRA